MWGATARAAGSTHTTGSPHVTTTRTPRTPTLSSCWGRAPLRRASAGWATNSDDGEGNNSEEEKNEENAEGEEKKTRG
eukprot:gene56077-1987_t